MSYYIRSVDSTLSASKEQIEKFHREYLDDLRKFLVLENFDIIYSPASGQIVHIDLNQVNYNGQDSVLSMIAPYLNDGYMEIHSEDGEVWRWVVKDGKLITLAPKIEWIEE